MEFRELIRILQNLKRILQVDLTSYNDALIKIENSNDIVPYNKALISRRYKVVALYYDSDGPFYGCISNVIVLKGTDDQNSEEFKEFLLKL